MGALWRVLVGSVMLRRNTRSVLRQAQASEPLLARHLAERERALGLAAKALRRQLDRPDGSAAASTRSPLPAPAVDRLSSDVPLRRACEALIEGSQRLAADCETAGLLAGSVDDAAARELLAGHRRSHLAAAEALRRRLGPVAVGGT